jgi:hypothetical protein
MTEEQQAEVLSRFGSEAVVYENSKHGMFVFAKPRRASWQRFQRDVTKKDGIGDAFDQLCRDCLVFPGDDKPDHGKLIALMDDYPGCSVEIGDKLALAARGGEASQAGKR